MEIIIFAFIPKSIFEFSIPKIKSRFSMHIFCETHINLHKAKIADFSRIQRSGAYYYKCWMAAAPFTVYLVFAAYAILSNGSKNFPNKPY